MMNTEQLLIQIKNLLHENPDLTDIAETSLSGIIENLKTRENSLELKAIAKLDGRNFLSIVISVVISGNLNKSKPY